MATIRYKYRWGRYVLASTVAVVAMVGVIRPHSVVKVGVVEVIDGDTFRVATTEGTRTVRVWGVDCPEVRQTFGNEAAAWAAYRLYGSTVSIEVKDIDQWGRMVCKVTMPDGQDFGEALVTEGMAWWAWMYSGKDMALKAAEERARGEGKGLWGEGRAVAPWEWRKGKR